ncbi:MAG TPA: nucleoside hydrolase [Firmicutes bacterium]|jgi:inosine-uridine nucleoside N-ribohydrolase|nr:nucleoside hydrolase [Bacillota bacterium]
MVKKLILDTDPGIDDALALIAAVSCREAEVLGVSVVAGNLPLETVTANASAILAFLDSPARVYPGATGPLYGKLQDASDIHGPGGLGGWRLKPDPNRVACCHAAEFMARTAAAFPGQVTLVTLGPLTNLALALEQHPREMQKLAGVVIMGGALRVPGNVTSTAEFNIWADPDAAQLVLNSGLDLTMVGLDVTKNMRLEKEDISRLAGGGAAARGAARMIEYAVREQGEYPFHDPLAFMAAVQPECFAFDTVPVAIETRGAICRGQTIADYSGPGNPGEVKVARKADYSKCRDFLLELWLDAPDR